jgi:hypothetical protein
MKNYRGVKPDDGADANNEIHSTSQQDLCVDNDDDGTGQLRTKSFPQSRFYHDGDSNVGQAIAMEDEELSWCETRRWCRCK